jgi:aminoglycoside phosphotransferase (APT) family kinase protein
MEDQQAEIRDVLSVELPGYRVDDVALLGAGLDNVASLVNDELVVRVSKADDPALRATRVNLEAGLLAVVGGFAPLPVPVPVFAAWGVLAYRKLPGVPLLDLRLDQRQPLLLSVAGRLGAFLAALHAIPLELVEQFVDVDNDSMSHWLSDAEECYAAVAREVPAPFRPRIEAFLHEKPPEPTHEIVFSHNDLGIEHVLVDPVTLEVTGVIDFSDAAMVDPAYDFGLVLRDLGPNAAETAFARYAGAGQPSGADVAAPSAPDVAARARAEFYARCSVLEDLRYGIDTGRQSYVGKSIAALTWLFPG